MAGDLGDEFLPTSAEEAAGADPRLASEGPHPAGDSGEVNDLRERLRTEGRVDIKGFVLTRETHDEVAVVDLLTDMTRFAGRSLILGVSRTGSPSATQTRLAARLRELGGACSLTAVADRQAARFGQYHYAAAGDQSGEKGDTQFGMATAIVGAVTGWVTGSGHEENTTRDDRIAEAR